MKVFKRVVASISVIVTACVAGAGSVTAQSSAAAQKFPPQFPGPGATKVFENEFVRVWDYTQQSFDNHMHRHIFDTMTVRIQSAPDFTRTLDGKVTIDTNDDLHPLEMMGRSRYGRAGMGPHAEWVLDLALPNRTIFIELKKTLSPDAVQWSTDPTGSLGAAFPLFETPRPSVLPTVVPTQKKWPSLGTVLQSAGVRKVTDNENATIWDEILTTTQPAFRKNIRDVVAVQIWDGVTTLVNGEDGQPTQVPRGADQTPRRRVPSVFYLPAGTGPYSLVAQDPYHPMRTLWFELKGTEAKDCAKWSTETVCK
jgi:hypothetical protein